MLVRRLLGRVRKQPQPDTPMGETWPTRSEPAGTTGLAFFDFLHGQTGMAPNGIELQPVLGFACLS
jgi:hypothetical protein